MSNQSAMQIITIIIIIINTTHKIGLYTLVIYKFIEYMDCHNIVLGQILWFNFTLGLIFVGNSFSCIRPVSNVQLNICRI